MSRKKAFILAAIIGGAMIVHSCGTKQATHSSKKNSTEIKQENGISIEDKLWEIVELNGKSVDGTAKTHYLIFHSKYRSLEAKANCNINKREYTITDGFKLKINSGISSLMHCPDNLDDELNQALDKVNNYTNVEKSLSLNGERKTPLIKLKLAE